VTRRQRKPPTLKFHGSCISLFSTRLESRLVSVFVFSSSIDRWATRNFSLFFLPPPPDRRLLFIDIPVFVFPLSFLFFFVKARVSLEFFFEIQVFIYLLYYLLFFFSPFLPPSLHYSTLLYGEECHFFFFSPFLRL